MSSIICFLLVIPLLRNTLGCYGYMKIFRCSELNVLCNEIWNEIYIHKQYLSPSNDNVADLEIVHRGCA